MTSPSCVKCGQRMQEGFVLDNTHGGNTVSSWVEGQPQRSFWFGVKLDDKKPLEVTTYRCTGCGYLESYAKA